MLKREVKNILLRMPNWLGDAVMATPLITDVRSAWPDAKITVMALASTAALFAADPSIEVFPFSREEPSKLLIQRLKRKNFDLAILLPNSFSSAWWCWRAGIKRRLGYAANGRSVLLTHAPSFPKERGKEHLVLTYKKLLAPLGIPLSDTPPSLIVSHVEETCASFSIPKEGWIVGINPGAAYGSAKCWPPERFRAVTEQLLAFHPHIHILYFGDKNGAPLVNSICEGLPSRVMNLSARTNLSQLMALISRCDLLLTNDSGPMHIAAALGVPLVALFGSTNEKVTGPYPRGSVIHKQVACSPCYKRTCPIDFRCMRGISVEEVFEKIKQHLI